MCLVGELNVRTQMLLIRVIYMQHIGTDHNHVLKSCFIFRTWINN